MSTSSSTARDWWDQRYLLTQVQGPWLKTLQAVMQRGGDQRASLDLSIKIRELAANIVRSKRYRLVSDYFAYYLSRTPAMYEANTFAGVTPHFYQAIISLYQAVCTSKHKMLVGTAGTMPLWVDPPTGWLGEGEGKFDLNNLRVPARVVVPMILKIMPLLSGDGRQQQFDRLMLPPPDKWPTFDEWTRASIERLDEITATRLGFDGRVEEDEYLQIMSYAYLERRYNLVPGYTVLVRLQEHPIFHQIVLMQKGSWIIARLERHRHNDILLMLSTEELATDSTVDFVKPMLLLADSFSNYALPALVATVYRDLVTVEEKAINKQRSNLARLRLPRKKKEEEDSSKPKFYTTSWQYIPRRLYLYNSKDESVASRRGLEETEQERQRAIRRWHSVCGHVRRYQDKPDGWIAKADKVDQALADGIILRTGETYVKPHARGLAALDELGEIDLATIPHYLRRKFE